MDSTNYREFSSFYDMKEWLKQGEFVLPAVYKTLNDGKYYFDDAVDISGIEDMLPSLFDYGGLQGITFNDNHEVSRVLCQYMDSHFMNTSETFIKINKDIVVQENDFEKSDLSNSIGFSLFNEDNGPETAFELDIEVDTHNGVTVNEQYRFTLSYGESSVQGLLSVNCEWHDYQIEVYVTTVDGGSWTGSINAKKYKKEEHFSNIGAFNMGFSYDMKMFENFKHYGSLKEKGNQKYHNMILPKQFAGSDITGIVIPEGVEYIGAKAFYHCDSLEYVKLPSTLKCIGRAAFQGCKSLKEIYIPSKCEVIETSAFNSCTSLRKLTISKGVKFIGERAFFNTDIVSLFIPSTVTYVGSKSFAYCSNLKKVYIGSNLHIIGNGLLPKKEGKIQLNGTAFYKSPIESFNVDKNNEYVKVGVNGELMIRTRKGWMIIKVPYSFNGMYKADPSACSMIRNLFEVGKERNIGESLTGINFSNIKVVPKNLCSGNNNIERLVMPHVHAINYHAFTGESIKYVQIGTAEYDECLSEYPIDLIRDKSDEHNPTLRFAGDCKINILQGNKSLYAYNKYFMPYLGSYNVDLNGEWDIDDTINPNTNLYDGVYYSTVSHNVNNGLAFMYIDIEGYDYFHCYIRSAAESNFDYVMISQLDVDLSGRTSSTSSAYVKETTKGNQQSSSALTKYMHVEYENIGGGSHRICVVYRKDGSVNTEPDTGYLIIPKSQVKKVKVKKGTSNKYVAVSLDGFIEESYGLGNTYRSFESTNCDVSGEEEYAYSYNKMRIYFSGSSMFTCYVGSSSESNYDFICVSRMDTDMMSCVEDFISYQDIEIIKDGDWLFTSHDEYYDISHNDLSTYKKLEIECGDKNEHFIDIYYVKDSGAYDYDDKGYVTIPIK